MFSELLDNSCLYCGKETTKGRNGYNKFCCSQCRRQYQVEQQEKSKPYYPFLSNEDWLYNQLVTQQKSKSATAKELGCRIDIVSKWADKFNIIPEHKQPSYYSLISNKDWLYDQRVVQKKRKDIIAKELGCSESTVNKWIKIHNIEDINFSKLDNPNLENKDLLFDLFVVKNLSQKEVSKELNCTIPQLRVALHKFNIKKSERVEVDNTPHYCLNCGKETHLDKADKRKGYCKFCCVQCKNEYKVKTSPYYHFVSDKNWLTHQRIDLKKSFETIASEIGCSITTIKRWIKLHNIETVMYNRASEEVVQKLNDKSLMEELYINNHLTCREIASQIGSSNSEVAKALNRLEIPLRASNDYERTFHKVSDVEIEIRTFITSLIGNENVKFNDRTILEGKELDIFIPSLNLAFEVDGVWWHCEVYKDKNYHLNKTLKCQEKGIQLIHITDLSWNTKREVWKNFIRNKLKKNSVKIYARKCIINELSVHEKNSFLEENHLQGKDKSDIKLGLYYENELVSVITFKKSRYNKNYDWELVRFASKGNINVVGGFSKLLNHFIKNHNPTSIITYAHRIYSNGDLYKKNGFELLKINPPSYSYYDRSNAVIIDRMNATKKMLMKRFNENDDSKTEHQIANDNNLFQYWNCGTIAFVMNCR